MSWRYRNLKKGETIQSGDQGYFGGGFWVDVPASWVGETLIDGELIRRKERDQPTEPPKEAKE